MFKVQHWEEKIKETLSNELKHQNLDDAISLLKHTESIKAYLPSKHQLTNAVSQARDWLQKVCFVLDLILLLEYHWHYNIDQIHFQVEDMQAKDSYPYYSTLETLVKKGMSIPINLSEKDVLTKALDSAKQWKEKTAKTFLRKNWTHGLMEALRCILNFIIMLFIV